MIKIQRILLPSDFSQASAAATRYACELAEKFDAELHVLHVLQFHAISTPDLGMGLALPKYIQESRLAAEKSLAAVVDPNWREGRKVATALAEGPAFVEIVRYAKENEIDLIVLSTHGRSGMSYALMGSVAERVVRKAPCPVLTINPQGRQFVMP